MANYRVVIPFATPLAHLVPPVACRLRRDFTAILHLIKAHAILHQASRREGEDGRIIATLADYCAVHELVNDLVSQGVEQTVSTAIRRTVEAVEHICRQGVGDEDNPRGQKDEPNAATIAQIAGALQIDRSSASRRVKQCLARGYLKNLQTKRGQPHRLVIGDPLPGGENVMPTPEEVRERWKDEG